VELRVVERFARGVLRQRDRLQAPVCLADGHLDRCAAKLIVGQAIDSLEAPDARLSLAHRAPNFLAPRTEGRDQADAGNHDGLGKEMTLCHAHGAPEKAWIAWGSFRQAWNTG
jgi:hypothetical protein